MLKWKITKNKETLSRGKKERKWPIEAEQIYRKEKCEIISRKSRREARMRKR